MAWPVETKAKAIAMLLLGTSVTAVSNQLAVPKPTISRWKVEGRRMMQEYWERHPEARWLMALGRNLQKNGPKKRATGYGPFKGDERARA